jgi:hypothetical protein
MVRILSGRNGLPDSNLFWFIQTTTSQNSPAAMWADAKIGHDLLAMNSRG